MDGLEQEVFESALEQEERVRFTAQEIPAAIEAILFVSGDPVQIARISDILGIPAKAAAEYLEDLIKKYENDPMAGITIRKADTSYCMITKPAMKKVLEVMYSPKMTPPLSQASYETLAVIAYNQPCTRAQIEAVRGVSSDSIVSRLLDRGWIEEAGTLDAPGRPTLFRTSRQFLLEFGISSTDELPSMELMSYKTIRDLEESLKNAAEGEDKQITIEGFMAEGKGETSDGNTGADSSEV
ncbi:MAG: SMC-Scp complex subunit ScpB [Clostridiales bacterium]|nr:SMC-Scp complex subunit ScpB [Clostridiales bacterium]